MLTAVLSLASALGSTVHDILMMRVVRSTPVFTALFWVQSVALVMFVPLWLIAVAFRTAPSSGAPPAWLP